MRDQPYKRELEYGETPWDEMTKDELLFEIRAYFDALISSRSALAISKCADPQSPYWRRDGTGGNALHKCETALEGLNDSDEYSERIYRTFFRYAPDLYFGPRSGFGWMACDECNVLTGGPNAPEACAGCGAPSRALEWRDLEPKT